jgi:thiosulfate/3-mercaptopyruvate sulfurtransferase
MTLPNLTPNELAERLTRPAGPTFLDVRTVAEFAAGRPKGAAANIPWEFRHPTTQAPLANDAFLLVVGHRFARDAALIVGDGGDGRAQAAAQCLRDAGFSDVTVLDGGFPAWLAARLPTTTDNREGVSYVSLLTRARRGDQAKAARGH